ncbi:MAG TPA: glycosyltransferase family 2 protein, partial [Tepidisphaeraceae bacterium]|nr:glycosyltransferase family 2 protein [Tepidisphaeraceae bacterium]
MRLLVVIVNYRTADLTIDCLKSLRNEIATIPDARVVVTDNASPDDSAERLSQWVGSCNWHEPVTFIPLERNCGFAAGNNAAIRPAIYSGDPPHYVLLLNPDTIVRPGGVRALVDFMDKHPAAGVAGSRLEHLDAQPQRSAFRFPTPLSELEEGTRIGCLTRLLSRRVVAPPPPSDACAVDWVAGASMMVRKEVFEKIGLLDEGYFMYYEE